MERKEQWVTIDQSKDIAERQEARKQARISELLFYLEEETGLDSSQVDAIRKAIAGEGRLVNVPFETVDGEVIGIAYLFDLLPAGETWAGKMFRQDQGGE